ncbi:uncharacterized protein UV8b_03881 [Ustilaginoidea virens]|uniref:Uncharacterized protein n=1 Tax=Ustilaginoidea virens TaxID=1159556 RepID=A0A063BLS5_USTVR|nr:uncharacterized protein UV8b_03881 [Ustilaginoidea virens]QUC19640.1 hypothetical protein UV8b_03881 [Ustilaginoidea virens]GAO13884.1 hypothetical protein UVI_02004000 [Ustilaginoidea virens]
MAPETPKAISSRLLTMKFMQRAAASASSKASPDSEAPSKKRKLDRSPAPGRINPNIDHALIQSALDDQEAARQAALQKHSSTDSQWTLKAVFEGQPGEKASQSMNIMYVGYGDIDDEVTEDNPSKGRTCTKPSKKVTSGRGESKPSDESDQASSDENEGANDKYKARSPGDRTNAAGNFDRSHQSRSQSRHDNNAVRAKQFRDKRKRKEVRLNKLTSISAAGGGQFVSQGYRAKATKGYNSH